MRRLIALFALALAAPVHGGEPEVTVRTVPAKGRTLIHEVIVPARAAAVWQAVATVEGWRTWAVPVARAVPGRADRFETTYDPAAPPGSAATIEQQWLVRDAPRRLVFRTTRTPAGFPHAAAYLKVVSTVTLQPAGRGATRVRLTGSGYPDGPEGDALIAFFRQGNAATLRQLHRRFASGPIDWQATAKSQ